MSYSKQLFAADVIGIEGTGTTGPFGLDGETGTSGATGGTGATGSGSGGTTPNVAFYTSQITTSFDSADINIPWNIEEEDSNYTLEGSPFELVTINATGLYRIHYSLNIENTDAVNSDASRVSVICGIDVAGTVTDNINGTAIVQLGGSRIEPVHRTFVASLTLADKIGIRVSETAGSGVAVMGGGDHVMVLEFIR